MSRFGTVVIVGVGLIGGSIGMALRGRGLVRKVVGLGRSTESIERARALGAIDSGFVEPSAAFEDAEVVVVCTPVTRIAADVRMAAGLAPREVLITDAGSTKRRLVEAVEADPAMRRVFVGAHPLAGSEQKGVNAARADLFEGRMCVLTPTERTPGDRLERAEHFWRSLGCRTRCMDLDSHDAALSRTSHLPHVMAAALARVVPENWLELGAGAFRDGTRVAGAPADLWAGIFLDNRAFVLEAVREYQAELAAFSEFLEANDEAAMREWWEAGRRNRQAYLDRTSVGENRRASRDSRIPADGEIVENEMG